MQHLIHLLPGPEFTLRQSPRFLCVRFLQLALMIGHAIGRGLLRLRRLISRCRSGGGGSSCSTGSSGHASRRQRRCRWRHPHRCRCFQPAGSGVVDPPLRIAVRRGHTSRRQLLRRWCIGRGRNHGLVDVDADHLQRLDQWPQASHCTQCRTAGIRADVIKHAAEVPTHRIGHTLAGRLQAAQVNTNLLEDMP